MVKKKLKAQARGKRHGTCKQGHRNFGHAGHVHTWAWEGGTGVWGKGVESTVQLCLRLKSKYKDSESTGGNRNFGTGIIFTRKIG